MYSLINTAVEHGCHLHRMERNIQSQPFTKSHETTENDGFSNPSLGDNYLTLSPYNNYGFFWKLTFQHFKVAQRCCGKKVLAFDTARTNGYHSN